MVPSNHQYPQGSLESQPWFHNDITRQETAELLQSKGQFLVRKTIDSKRRTAVLVLSVNAGTAGIKHFIMQISEKGEFRLEGSWFKSIQLLINYHITNGKAHPIGIKLFSPKFLVLRHIPTDPHCNPVLFSICSGKPITGRTPVVIRQAVLRDRWNLLHRDIRLKQFLGKGENFEILGQIRRSSRVFEIWLHLVNG